MLSCPTSLGFMKGEVSGWGRGDGVMKGRFLDEVMVVTVFSGLEQW